VLDVGATWHRTPYVMKSQEELETRAPVARNRRDDPHRPAGARTETTDDERTATAKTLLDRQIELAESEGMVLDAAKFSGCHPDRG
jgi:hypothetical protein